jgi:DNA replication and repair protein RecF
VYVSRLSLTDFRSYEQVDLALDRGASAFVGPNGQGKTNLIEALGYAATLSSHRVAGDAPLVRTGAARAVIRVRSERGDAQSVVEVEINPGQANRAQVNRAPVRRARDVLGIVRTVLFAPEDLALVKGDPDGRRRFLDELAVQVAPRMSGVLADYDRILRQRNALLKSAAPPRRAGRRPPAPGPEPPDDGPGPVRALGTLDVWDAKLAEVGAEVLAARLRLIAELGAHVGRAYEQVSDGQGDIALGYHSSLDAAADDAELDGDLSVAALNDKLLEAMARVRSREIDRGVSLVGPHRDDLVLGLGGLPAKGYASHGESWSLAFALRLATYHLLTHGSVDAVGGPIAGWADGSEPVLILDDVFAELDVQRRSRLAALVGSAEQVLVTAAVPHDIPEALVGARYDVMAGRVNRVG